MITKAINAVLLDSYKRENKLPPSLKLGTFGWWIIQGYKPKKGIPSTHKCFLWTKTGLKNCWLWTEKEVEKL